MYERLVFSVRILLGLQFLLGGINWWYKIFPFPNMNDPAIIYSPDLPQKVEVGRMMIETGWMFTMAKVIEVTAGLALLTNRFVPLMLVVSITVALSTFVVDALIWGEFTGWLNGTLPFSTFFAEFLDMIFFGGAVLIMQGFLMIAYLHYYVPMMKVKPIFEPNQSSDITTLQPGFFLEWSCVRKAVMTLGVIAAIFGVLSTGWFILMIKQWALPWSSLRILVG